MYKEIQINIVNTAEIPAYYLTIMNSFIGIIVDDKFVPSPLTNKELDLYAKILSKNLEYNSLPDIQRAEYIHSNYIRKQIRESLGITSANYNNLLKRISEKVIVFGGSLYVNGKVNKEFDKEIINNEGIRFSFKTEKRLLLEESIAIDKADSQ